MRFLLIDDEENLVNALRAVLREKQYVCDVALDGEEGLDLARAGIYDLLIVDVMLPRLSGFELVRTLREDGDKTPILLLTARAAEDDRVTGLDCGADDYLVKPFGVNELMARIRALTRRVGDLRGTDHIAVGDYSLDLIQRRVAYRGDLLELTQREFQLMELFMRNAGRILAKDTLFDRVWGFDNDVDSNVVEAYVHILRKKLDAQRKRLAGENVGTTIQTVRGMGYLFKGM
ncbi:response regulator transcription factor [Ferroacidibacillus organovorans]|uniref:Two-component system response regulator n=1 Tax=Ferroacidibacillus organovorans TaxID=1765683 RepID=A0A124IW23_9BACL|nr:response regulator transcription factor [Ferroacidibacillus organovorans]KUO96066.1 two-component system response regulator [Ferroacidibacillus organovorans]